MKSLGIVWACVLFSACCGPSKDRIERIREDGVDVVMNHVEPYRTGGPATFSLDEIFRLDTEDPEFLKIGIPDIHGFDVNSRGDIFILRTIRGSEDFIFKFDRNGKFAASFGHPGEGPGELQSPRHIAVDAVDEVLVVDGGRALLAKYGREGKFIGAKPWPKVGPIAAGPGGTLIFRETDMNFETGKPVYSSSLKILDSGLMERSAVAALKVEMEPTDFRAIEPLLCWTSSRDEIFIASEERGYEISVFDRVGKLKRKIRKEFEPIPVSEKDREKILKPLPKEMRAMAHFPESHPPIQALIAAEDGKLLVETFEPGGRSGEYVFDIFNPDGAFVGQKSLDVYLWENYPWARVKDDRFYALREKANGFKELVISRLTWE